MTTEEPNPLSDIDSALLEELEILMNCSWYNTLLMLRMLLVLTPSQIKIFDKAIAIARPSVKVLKRAKPEDVIKAVSVMLEHEKYQGSLSNEQIGKLRFLIGICTI